MSMDTKYVKLFAGVSTPRKGFDTDDIYDGDGLPVCRMTGDVRHSYRLAVQIVRSFNSHASLVAALERFKNHECTCADGGPGFQCDACEARSVLASSKGGGE